MATQPNQATTTNQSNYIDPNPNPKTKLTIERGTNSTKPYTKP